MLSVQLIEKKKRLKKNKQICLHLYLLLPCLWTIFYTYIVHIFLTNKSTEQVIASHQIHQWGHRQMRETCNSLRMTNTLISVSIPIPPALITHPPGWPSSWPWTSGSIMKKEVARASLVPQMVKNLSSLQKTQALLCFGRPPGEGQGYPLQYSCQRIPWTEERGGLQSMGSQRIRHYWATNYFHFSS